MVRMLDIALGPEAYAPEGMFLVAPDGREDEARAQLARPAFSRAADLQAQYLPTVNSRPAGRPLPAWSGHEADQGHCAGTRPREFPELQPGPRLLRILHDTPGLTASPTVMAAVALMHEQVHQRTGEKQEVRKNTQGERVMLTQDVEGHNEAEGDQGNAAPAAPPPDRRMFVHLSSA